MAAVWVFVGGGAGSVARWGLAVLLPQPGATLLANVLGSFALAFLSHPALGVGEPWRTTLGMGALGGFTTYSTFNLQLFAALQEGAWLDAALLLGGTWAGCLAGAGLGWWLAGAWRG